MKVPPSYLRMIESRIGSSKYVLSEKVKQAFLEVPREEFVLENEKRKAYVDKPLHIPSGQTISAPTMYALMLSSELGDPQLGMKVLEIGTGSGYGAALLAWVVGQENVYSIERHQELVDFAKANLDKVGMKDINLIHDNGTMKIPDFIFDRIIVTASGRKVPEIYIRQLNHRGRIIMPIVNEQGEQWIWKITRNDEGEINYERQMQVLFVPLIYDEN